MSGTRPVAKGFLAAALAGALAMLCGCGASTQLTSAAPPWKVCGHVLVDSAAGPFVVDVSRWPVGQPIRHETVGDSVDLVLSHDCSLGAGVTFSPPQAAVIAKSVAAGGGLVAAVIHPTRKRFDIRITEADGTTRALKVRLR